MKVNLIYLGELVLHNQWQKNPPHSVLENPGLVPLIWVSFVTTNVLFLLFSTLPLIVGPLNDFGIGGSIYVFK